MENPKFCKDCRNFNNVNPPECLAVTRKDIDLVKGEVTWNPMCGDMRQEESECGPTGKLFEPKVQ